MRACARMSWSQPWARMQARSSSVDFVPGSTTTSASRGRGRAREAITRSTPGSSRKGSKSSAFAMRGSSGTTTLTRPRRERSGPPCPACSACSARSARPTESSAGSRCAAWSHGTTPRHGQLVRRSISRTPSAKRVRSPRKRLITKLVTRAASAGSSTTRVPTSAAMAPPRSMSASRQTGASTRRAKPMLAMSFRRRLVSAGLPAPSTTTRSDRAASRSKLSSTGRRRAPRRSRKSPAGQVAATLPRTTTCAAPSDSGFSSTGFMSADGGSPAARAWRACARPISPPPGHAAALFDMFCGLNGVTARPRRRATRQSPVTTVDLPACEPVAWTISTPCLTRPPRP